MGRGKLQRSKRARKHRKEAEFAGVRRNTGRPSHVTTKRPFKECRYREEEKGVSLIETLMVMLIIAILAACAIPCYATFIEKVRALEW